MKAFLIFTVFAALFTAGCGNQKSDQSGEASLAELNRDLSVVMMKNGGQLPGTNEFAAFLATTGKSFPTAPPGKKIVLDPVEKQFVIQSQ